ncbi:tetratricopeptide repeat-containing sulfotransferase family protein [Agrilutibacter solisilvae]|uniref:Sulfotransferase n=1 Tax=Agrilutibacter solisilvae TaxID=2763317 RepID=A0A974XWY4_9GAMM|nr:sulfotransferase [Lysobacter solisilvae]QSX77342.1 sulfotransferase [Lysobacter solisilvae]
MSGPTPDQASRYSAAVAALNAGDWARAQQLAMYLLREVPGHAGVAFVAGVAAMQLRQMPLAASCLQRSVELNPNRADYLAQYARALAQSSRTREAGEVARRAMALSPTDAMTMDTLGVVLTQANEYEAAAQMFRRVAELEPERASYRFNHATALVFAGELDRAEAELEACLRLEPRYWKAYLTLSQLRRWTPQDNHVQRLEAMLATPEADEPEARMFLDMALSKELEDLGDHARSFDALVRGKAAGGGLRRYSFAQDAALFDAIETTYPGAAPADAGLATDAPIFIFGMPRSGTTLVERILSSHPQVRSAGELQDFSVAFKRTSGSRTPELLDVDTITQARRADWRQMGQAYVDSTRGRSGGRAHFIDKLPHNFLYAGYIANALPQARLICIRRDPVDTCLSNLRQLFAQNSPYYDYSFDLLDIGRYYVRFHRLMEFWQRQLPGRILQIEYEQLVDQQEAWSRRVVEFCGLPWDEACLRFEENAAPVATASAAQVRVPMYRTAVRRWKRYEAQLQPLLALLADAGIAVDRAD